MSSKLLWAIIGAGGLWFLSRLMKEAKEISRLPQQEPTSPVPDYTGDQIVQMPVYYPPTNSSAPPDVSQWHDVGAELAERVWGYSGVPTANQVKFHGRH